MKLICGDCLEEMKKLPENSIDAVITDPPYGLVSIAKRWSGKNVKNTPGMETNEGSVWARKAKGFMGKEWDGSGIEYNVELWKECLRVLKPGGYVLAFGGTRTCHKLTTAIEDAGFEIRDMIAWVYGSGFPKSLNIGKAVDKLRVGSDKLQEFAELIKSKREEKKISQSEADKFICGGTTMYSFFEGRKDKPLYFPNNKHYKKMKEMFGLDDKWDGFVLETNEKIIGYEDGDYGFQKNGQRWNKDKKVVELSDRASEYEGWGTALKPALEPITVARKPLSEKTVAENVLKWGTGGIAIDACRVPLSYAEHECDGNNACKDPSHKDDQKNHKQNIEHQDESVSSQPRQNDHLSNDASDVQNLKSAQDCQDYCSVCRRPYDEHPHSEEVGDLKSQPLRCDAHGLLFRPCDKHDNRLNQSNSYNLKVNELHTNNINIDKKSQAPQGRFPANLIHSGEDEVVDLFPDTKSGGGNKGNVKDGTGMFGNGKAFETDYVEPNSGSASRFFYCAKASKSERNRGCEGLEEKQTVGGGGGIGDYLDDVNSASGKYGSEKAPAKNNHPTVKPIALMEYLVKLVSREGATVLDPFMGSGSTGVACKNLNRKFIGIEKEEEYIKIAEARIK